MTHEDKQKLAEQIAEKAMSAKNVTYAVVQQAVYKALNARDEEMKQLRNPWISVEDRLPEVEKLVIGTNGTHFFPVAYNKHDNNWRLVLGMIFAMEVPFSFIIKWMPIPELKKGE